MEIIVTGRRMTISEPLREYVEEKIGNSVKVFNISPMTAEVVLRKERNPANPRPAIAEVTIRTKGHIIRTEESEEDMYAAIDVAAAKVERQLRKYKTRVVDRRLRAKKLGEVLAPENEVPAPTEHEEYLEDLDKVVRVKELELDALTEEEALIQLDLLGHDFYVYLNSVDGLVNVMYRRKDGSYGIIKPRIETLDK
ncbi:MAG: ribosome-associated translation inhibitor RaiA [Coriobacteriales bacterium]|jgi:putative sigma-54 modulation protein|nr:ribosome-associated translation inhibitor RaiA [Coriobacteriales bacterium]